MTKQGSSHRGAGRRIAVLFHARARDGEIRHSAVHRMADLWRDMGYEVEYLRGLRRRPEADLLFVHVNLSVVPEDYLAFARSYPASVNARVGDIRKSTTNPQVLHDGDTWEGPVIAKSDLNYAGLPELALRPMRWLRRGRLGKWTHRSLGRLNAAWGPSPFASWRDYRFFDRVQDVPEELCRDPRVVLERFLPEREGDLFALRMYQFLGSRATCVRLLGPDPLVKATTSVQADRVDADPGIEAIRQRLGLDYGKLDYVLHEGRVVLLDANKTTGHGLLVTDALIDRRRYRAEGIHDYFA